MLKKEQVISVIFPSIRKFINFHNLGSTPSLERTKEVFSNAWEKCKSEIDQKISDLNSLEFAEDENVEQDCMMITSTRIENDYDYDHGEKGRLTVEITRRIHKKGT